MSAPPRAVARRLAPPPAVPLPRARRTDLAARVAAGGILVLLATFVVWPLVRVLAASVTGAGGPTLGHYGEFFGTWRLARILLQSLAVAAASTLITLAVALVLAYGVTRTDIPGKRFITFMSRLPLIAPPFLASLAFILLFGGNGVVTQALGIDASIYGAHGIVLAQVFSFLPQAYILLARALASIDPALEDAAENLGAGGLTILWRVTLALARPGFASAALSVFILCLTDFGNPILIGGRYHVLATEIYARVIETNDVPAAATMGVVLLVPCLLAFLLNASWIGMGSSVPLTPGAPSPPRPTAPLTRWVLFTFAAGVAALVAITFALIVLGSVVRLWGSDWSLSLRHYTFESVAEGSRPIWNSVRLAITAGVLGTTLALVTAYVIERRRASLGARTARALEAMSLCPAALPGTVVGLGYLLAFEVPPVLPAGTMWILVASVVFWKFPVAVRAAITTLTEVDPAVEEAAVSLGAGALTTFARVVLPLLKGAACSIFVYFFINGMVTVSAVIFLVSPGFNLATVATLGQVEHGSPGVACALGTVLLGIVIGAVALLRALVSGTRVVILTL